VRPFAAELIYSSAVVKIPMAPLSVRTGRGLAPSSDPLASPRQDVTVSTVGKMSEVPPGKMVAALLAKQATDSQAKRAMAAMVPLAASGKSPIASASAYRAAAAKTPLDPPPAKMESGCASASPHRGAMVRGASEDAVATTRWTGDISDAQASADLHIPRKRDRVSNLGRPVWRRRHG
jgi:hypothetical protein